jgi:hypothetical protein
MYVYIYKNFSTWQYATYIVIFLIKLSRNMRGGGESPLHQNILRSSHFYFLYTYAYYLSTKENNPWKPQVSDFYYRH